MSDLSRFWENDVVGLLKGHPDQGAAQKLIDDGRAFLAAAAGAAQDLPALISDITSLIGVIGKDSVDVASKNFMAAPSDVVATLSAVKKVLADGAKALADAKAAASPTTST